MATRKKAKSRRATPARPKRRKTPVRRKGAKPRKKATARRAPTKKRGASPARKRKSPAVPRPSVKVETLPGERIGVVTHYFSHLAVAVLRLDQGVNLRVGERIHIRGHTTDFGQRVDSLQVEHQPVMEVGATDDFGIKVIDHARENDVVYRVL